MASPPARSPPARRYSIACAADRDQQQQPQPPQSPEFKPAPFMAEAPQSAMLMGGSLEVPCPARSPSPALHNMPPRSMTLHPHIPYPQQRVPGQRSPTRGAQQPPRQGQGAQVPQQIWPLPCTAQTPPQTSQHQQQSQQPPSMWPLMSASSVSRSRPQSQHPEGGRAARASSPVASTQQSHPLAAALRSLDNRRAGGRAASPVATRGIVTMRSLSPPHHALASSLREATETPTQPPPTVHAQASPLQQAPPVKPAWAASSRGLDAAANAAAAPAGVAAAPPRGGSTVLPLGGLTNNASAISTEGASANAAAAGLSNGCSAACSPNGVVAAGAGNHLPAAVLFSGSPAQHATAMAASPAASSMSNGGSVVAPAPTPADSRPRDTLMGTWDSFMAQATLTPSQPCVGLLSAKPVSPQANGGRSPRWHNATPVPASPRSSLDTNESRQPAQQQQPRLIEWPVDVLRHFEPIPQLLPFQYDAGLPGQSELRLVSGACQIPHPNKLASGGEDSFFISPNGCALGVADGVGEWDRLKVNPRQMADEIMTGASATVASFRTAGGMPVVERAVVALREGYRATRSFGGAAVLIAALDSRCHSLGVANLGDCGLRQLRRQYSRGSRGIPSVTAKTREQQHFFNCPFQLSRLPTREEAPALAAAGKAELAEAVSRGVQMMQDSPDDADVYALPVMEGDLFVVASDGLWDNLHDREVCDLAARTISPQEAMQAFAEGPGALQGPGNSTDPGKLAAVMAHAAFHRARETSTTTPFAERAREAGYSHSGGKLDDITVVCSWVVRVAP